MAFSAPPLEYIWFTQFLYGSSNSCLKASPEDFDPWLHWASGITNNMSGGGGTLGSDLILSLGEGPIKTRMQNIP